LAAARHWEGLGLEATRFSWRPDGEQGEASTMCPAATIGVSGKKVSSRLLRLCLLLFSLSLL
jgi:hypothetical protein